jgi:chaperone required for assembly of F1-ATPase
MPKGSMELNAAKVTRRRSALTGSKQTTLTHSLEAFVGTLDYDQVKNHKMPNGSMLVSPSSTAAYLMNTTEWDDKAEAYSSDNRNLVTSRVSFCISQHHI